jgi:hypothetical protein
MSTQHNVVSISKIRALTSLLARSALAKLTGKTFEGKRDVEEALGYVAELTPTDYYRRYRRGGIAKQIVRAFPEGTWRGQGELIEDDDPTVVTEFEKAWFALSDKLDLWPTFLQADVLAGLGEFSILMLIGPGGRIDQPLTGPISLDNLVRLQPIGPEDVDVKDWVTDISNPRFGQPFSYAVKRISANSAERSRVVHWSRCIHIADEVLDKWGIGTPRLEACWNNLDDLIKVVGGGSEAHWLRAHQGYQFDLDKETELAEGEEDELQEQVDNFVNKMSRTIQTRGMKITSLGSDVASFEGNGAAVMAQICGTVKIPQRILMGSERGQLASEQDRINWTERVQDRRGHFGAPGVVMPFVRRMINLGVLPEPKKPTKVWWPQVFDLSDKDRADIAAKWAEINQKYRGIVVTDDEIRDLILGLKPLSPEQRKLAISMLVTKQDPAGNPSGKGKNPNQQTRPTNQAPDSPANPDLVANREQLEKVEAELKTLRVALRERQLPPEVSLMLSHLGESVTALSQRTIPAPIVNVTVEPPAAPATKRVQQVKRDENGLISEISSEEVVVA